MNKEISIPGSVKRKLNIAAPASISKPRMLPMPGIVIDNITAKGINKSGKFIIK